MFIYCFCYHKTFFVWKKYTNFANKLINPLNYCRGVFVY